MNREQLACYVILDPDHLGGRTLEEVARAAARGGATMLQWRAERRSTLAQIEDGRRLLAVSREYGLALIVNDRVDVALALEAEGVHLGHRGVEDMPPEIARRLLGPGALVGLSLASVQEALLARELGVDYISVGPIFGSRSKGDAGPAVGPERLREIRAVTSLPLCAIGGIDPTNAEIAVAAGADGVAVIASVGAAPDPTAAVRALVEAVASGFSRRPPRGRE